MRVLLNGLTALKPRTGVGQYTARLAAELEHSLPRGEFAIYPPQPWQSLARRALQRKKSAAPAKSAVPGLKSKLAQAMKRSGRAALGVHFANYCRTYGAKLYHEPNFLPFAASVPTVITIHDLSVLLHPEWHPADRVREHVRRLERAAANAAHVITDTEQVRREVIAELRVPAAKVTAVHLGVGPEFRPTLDTHWPRSLNLPARYFLCVGTIEPRKNLLTAMQAFARLPRQLREQWPLLLAGPWGWRADAEFAFYDRIGRDAGIRHLGYVPDDAMPALYSGATATLYPSLYEGFGLPPLEAVACGSIAICSSGTAAVREVMGNAAMYCAALDIDGWCDAMHHCLLAGRASDGVESSIGPRRSRVRVTDYCDRYTWARTAAATLAVYDGVLNSTYSLRRAA